MRLLSELRFNLWRTTTRLEGEVPGCCCFSSWSACFIQHDISSLYMKLRRTSLVRRRKPVNVIETGRIPGISSVTSSKVRKGSCFRSRANQLYHNFSLDFSSADSTARRRSYSSAFNVTVFSTNRFSKWTNVNISWLLRSKRKNFFLTVFFSHFFFVWNSEHEPVKNRSHNDRQ